MNPSTPLAGAFTAPLPDGERRIPVPDTSLLPGSEKAQPAAVGLLKRAVLSAHRTIDRLADKATPAVRQLGEGMAAAEVALQTKTGQLRETSEAWGQRARSTVRSEPLAFVAGAFALGFLIGRLTR